MSSLRLENISKIYTSKRALDDVSFEVPSQSIFGLLGPNGAGKTTLIRIITQIIAADTGKVFLDQRPMKQEMVNEIGYMPEERGLYKKMKVGEVLIYLARLKNLTKKDAVRKVEEWLTKFDLINWKDKKVEELSKGMQQKVQFIATVIHQPKLLILDEPFTGLDPINSNLIKEEISSLRNNGATIIFSTHRMEQVEEICENIVLIDNGKKILEGKVAEVRQRFKQNKFSIKFRGEIKAANQSLYEIIQQKDDELILKMLNGSQPNALLQQLMSQNAEITAFNEILPSLSEIFIQQVRAVKL